MTFTLHYTIQHDNCRYKLSCPLESPLGSPTEKECLTAILDHCGVAGEDVAECIKEYNAEVGCMMPDDRAIVGYTLAPPEMSQEVARELLDALDYLLQQTVDMDLEHGIELTEGEKEARSKALAAIATAKGSSSAA